MRLLGWLVSVAFPGRAARREAAALAALQAADREWRRYEGAELARLRAERGAESPEVRDQRWERERQYHLLASWLLGYPDHDAPMSWRMTPAAFEMHNRIVAILDGKLPDPRPPELRP